MKKADVTMFGRWYRLEGTEAVPCEPLEAAWHFSNDNRIVQVSETALHQISTVFLGLDHSHGGGKPHIFETMVFEKDESSDPETRIQYEGAIGVLARYSTWEESEVGHERIHGEVVRLEQKALVAANFHRKTVIDE